MRGPNFISISAYSESAGGLNGVNTHKRYLQCPAALTMYHLKKFIRLKYDLSNTHKVNMAPGSTSHYAARNEPWV